MTEKIPKTIRFSSREIENINKLAKEEGLTFSQVSAKLIALGMTEFHQLRRYNVQNVSNFPDHLPAQERKHIEFTVQNTLMLETIIKSLSKGDHKEIIQSIRQSSYNVLKKDFFPS